MDYQDPKYPCDVILPGTNGGPPLVSCTSGEHTEAEILARWTSTQNGHINGAAEPPEQISIAVWMVRVAEYVKNELAIEADGYPSGRADFRLYALDQLKQMCGREGHYKPPPELRPTDVEEQLSIILDNYVPPDPKDSEYEANDNKNPKKKQRGESPMNMDPINVRWLWPNYIPLAKLIDFQGDPGQGKSLIMDDIAAIITAGLKWPTGETCEPAGVIIVSGEDDLKDTIVPRLMAAGADRSKIWTYTLKDDPLLEVPRDIESELAPKIRELKAKLVIFDPIESFIAEAHETNKNQSIRKLLAKLAHMAWELDCTIMNVRHLNKDAKTKSPMYRGGGSIAMNAAARQVFMVGPSPDDKELHVLAHVKGNCGPRPASLGYRIQPIQLPDYPNINTIKIEWTGVVDYEAWQLLQEPEVTAKKTEMGQKLIQCVTRMREILGDGGEHESAEVEKLLRRETFSHGTIFKAREHLGVKSRRKAFGGAWTWSMDVDWNANDSTGDFD